MSSEPFLLYKILEHNPAVRRALAAQAPEIEEQSDWYGVGTALSDGKAAKAVEGFLGNKSERAMLAAILMQADYAALANRLSPDFWTTWSGLDRRNKAFLLAMLDDAFD
jgi:hypothetical protein